MMRMTLKKARDILATVDRIGWQPEAIAEARRIVAAADSAPPPPPSAALPDTPSDRILLGTDSSGRMVSLADVQREGVGIFWRLTSYTPAGESTRQAMLQMTPEIIEARALGINCELILAAAKTHLVMGKPLADPLEAIRGEIAMVKAARRQPAGSSGSVRGL